MKVLLHPKAADYLQRCSESQRIRIKHRLGELEDQPEKKGERLKHSPFYSLRIGDYRVIFMIDQANDQVVVLFIGHRRDVYDDFDKLF